MECLIIKRMDCLRYEWDIQLHIISVHELKMVVYSYIWALVRGCLDSPDYPHFPHCFIGIKGFYGRKFFPRCENLLPGHFLFDLLL